MSSGEPPTAGAQLVVVGSSAGGIEALLDLVANLPPDFPAPIVLAQHLDPQRQSHLASLLQARTSLAVVSVAEHETLQPGAIYVIPSDRDVEITGHQVSSRAVAGQISRPSIDHLLTSAAYSYREGLIAVILTGSGQDGALGAQAVKAYGGTVVIQNPATAQYPAMPGAVAPVSVDVVADLEAMAPLLVDLLAGSSGRLPPSDDEDLRPFLERLREQTGLDFLAYKRPTIERRLQRRMATLGMTALGEYRQYLDRHPTERQRLVESFLIKVTEFFRDREVFDYLQQQILPELIADARKTGELRLWSAGCATGEEAYSLAILVAEALGEEQASLPVRIFATDVAPEAVEFARRGIFAESALAEMSPALIDRHFLKTEAGYEVRKTTRNMVVFGEHDLGYRAPFPRIDLVLCRNVLIYFTPELQRRALQRFAFALRPGKYLILGKSETVSPLPAYFSPVQPRLKIFNRVGDGLLVTSEQFTNLSSIDPLTDRMSRRPAVRHAAALRFQNFSSAKAGVSSDDILNAMSAGVVAVDRHYDILTINIAARILLGLQTPAIGEDLVHAVGANLREVLRDVLDAALRGEPASRTHQLPPDSIDGVARDLWISGLPRPSDGAGDDGGLAAVLQIMDVSPFAQRQRELEARQSQLEAATQEVRSLRTANQRMASEHSRLRAEVEGLQLAQEESLAAAEEIETLHEEQQATNEELETMNEELQATVEELQATVAELHARTAELESIGATRESRRQESVSIREPDGQGR
jgi:two-component system CheB/CheR fusion protein